MNSKVVFLCIVNFKITMLQIERLIDRTKCSTLNIDLVVKRRRKAMTKRKVQTVTEKKKAVLLFT